VFGRATITLGIGPHSSLFLKPSLTDFGQLVCNVCVSDIKYDFRFRLFTIDRMVLIGHGLFPRCLKPNPDSTCSICCGFVASQAVQSSEYIKKKVMAPTRQHKSYKVRYITSLIRQIQETQQLSADDCHTTEVV